MFKSRFFFLEDVDYFYLGEGNYRFGTYLWSGKSHNQEKVEISVALLARAFHSSIYIEMKMLGFAEIGDIETMSQTRASRLEPHTTFNVTTSSICRWLWFLFHWTLPKFSHEWPTYQWVFFSSNWFLTGTTKIVNHS